MSTFVGIPPFSNLLWVAMKTMHFHIAHTKKCLRTPSFRIQEVPMNNLVPMKKCPGGARYRGIPNGLSVLTINIFLK